MSISAPSASSAIRMQIDRAACRWRSRRAARRAPRRTRASSGPSTQKLARMRRDQLVGRGGVDDVAGGEVEGLARYGDGSAALAVDREVDAVVAQDARQQRDVGEVGHVLERQRLVGEQARDHQRQGRVLGAGDREWLPLSGWPPTMLMRSMLWRPVRCWFVGTHFTRQAGEKTLSGLLRSDCPSPGAPAHARRRLAPAPAPCVCQGWPAARRPDAGADPRIGGSLWCSPRQP